MDVEQGTVTAVSRSDTHTFTKPVRDGIVLIAGVGVQGDVHAGVHVKHRSRVRADPTQPNFRQVHLIQRELFDDVSAKGYAVASGDLGENVTTSGIDLLGLPVGTILRFGPPAAPGGSVAGGTAGGSVAGGTAAGGTAGGSVAGGTAAGSVAGGTAAGSGFGGTAAGGTAAGGTAAGSGEEDSRPLTAVLEAAAQAELDSATAASAVAIAAAVAGDRGDDPRPAVVLAGLRNPCGQINGFAEGLLKEVLGHDAQGNLVRKAGVMAVVLRGGRIRPGDAVTAELPPPPHARLERV